ncbi:MAG: nuclear transport factor 2 family protein [Candidatus Caldarchaeum sp.]
MTQLDEVLETIRRSFELGRSGLFEEFSELHAENYTRFSDLPPLRLQDRDEALKLKASLLSELVDFEYEIVNPSIQLMGNIALALFYMRYKGLAVNDYAFEGQRVEATVRCSVLLQKTVQGWKIVHEHLSKAHESFLPD